MDLVVWIVGGILALNVVTVGVLWAFAALRRHGAERRRRRLEHQWHVRRLPASASSASPLRRATGLGAAAALVWALILLGGADAGRVFGSALGLVVPGLAPDREGRSARVAVERADVGEQPDAERTASPSLGSGQPPGSPSFTAGGAPGDRGAPATVAALPRSSSAIQLTWALVPDATGYQIERREDGAAGWLAIKRTSEGVTVYTDDKLVSGTTYYYRIVAITDEGEAAPSDVTSATTPPAPPAGTILTATTSSPVAIDLSWPDVAEETGYRIERSADGVTGWVTIATTGQDVTSHTDAGLSPGTTYHYRVFAANEGGESAPSDVTSATTGPQQPAMPEAAEPEQAAAVQPG